MYLAMHIHHIEELEPEENEELFDVLFKHAMQEKYRLTVG